MSLYLSYQEEKFDPYKYRGQPMDYAGRTVKGLRITRRAADTKDGQRQWEGRCMDCGRDYIINDAQIASQHFQPCACKTRGKNGR
jgi:hypothetical protein